MQGFDPWKDSGAAVFDARRANKVCRFIETHLKHSKGEFAGKPFKLQPWQRWLTGHLFGWHKPDGTRRFKKCFILIPRKNGKTTLTAALGIVMLVADNEAGAEVYCAAAEKEQAALVFNEASEMVRQCPELDDSVKILTGTKSMKFETTGSYWRVLTSEPGTKHGLNPHAYIVDEVHVQKNDDLMHALRTGVSARRQPMGIYLTTSDFAGETPCNRMMDNARRVRDGKISDPTLLPLLYETPSDADWTSEKVWYAANPNLGISKKLEYMRDECREAINNPAYENTFKRLDLNMQTEQEKRWMQLTEWDASGQKLEAGTLKGQPCFLGMDMSSVADITALVLYFPDQIAALCRFFVPRETAEKRIEYEMWARQGYLEISEGRIIDQSTVRAAINDLNAEYQIRAIAYDPWNAAQLARDLGDSDGFQMVEFRQGYKSMNEPTKALMRMVLEHKLNHFANPVLRWMAANAQAQEDPAGNIKLTKPNKDSPLKVDGMIALVMAFGMAMVAEEPEAPLENGGISFL